VEILIRKRDDRGWRKVAERKFDNEAVLQHILYESPEVIPIEKLGEKLLKPKVFIKEAGLPGSGYSDLIGIDEEGSITIIECKLAVNTDIRRKVIGQLLEYAAYLWHMQHELFDGICCKAEKWGDKHLVDVMRHKIGDTLESWSQEDFTVGVASNLEKGSFRLIIAVDAINEELNRIVDFMNSRGKDAPQIYVLQMRHFPTDDLEILVPEVVGQPPPQAEEKLQMNEDLLTRNTSDAFKRLYAGLKTLSVHERFKPSSFTKRGFVFRYNGKNLLFLRPNCITMWLGTDPSGSFLDTEAHEAFWSSVFKIPGFAGKMDKKYPEVVVDDELWKPEHVDAFIAAVDLLESLT